MPRGKPRNKEPGMRREGRERCPVTREQLETVIRRLRVTNNFTYTQLAWMFSMDEQTVDDIMHERPWIDPLAQQPGSKET